MISTLLSQDTTFDHFCLYDNFFFFFLKLARGLHCQMDKMIKLCLEVTKEHISYLIYIYIYIKLALSKTICRSD
jgi:hypothetical protein